MVTIYHLTTLVHWESQSKNELYCSPTFNEEGFIHASSKSQLAATAKRYFSNESAVILLAIQVNLLHPQVIYENSPSLGQEFPHIYGGINMDAIAKVETLELASMNWASL